MPPSTIHNCTDELDRLDVEYARKHTAKEDAFWASKMGTGTDPSRAQAALDTLEVELHAFLQDAEHLRHARALAAAAETPDDRIRAAGWVRTFEAHAIDSAAGRSLAAELIADEGRLERARGAMPLGYHDPQHGFVQASSVKLSTLLRANPDETVRRAAWEGLRSIEPYVLSHGFLEIVKKRNALGRMLGAEDYYDWKTRRVESMSKAQVFALLDELERDTREAASRAIRELGARHGREHVTPWNIQYLVSGDTTRDQDPYFPFREAISRWGRSFAALGITFRGATLVLDLLDRKGKYENGFMHGPVVAWRRGHTFQPARIHFTANAIPGMVGSGHRAMATLFHEGGHAAHFANVDMPSPCFGQEFAPTSVAFAETQSMFCDSLLDDADWQRRYALDADGQPMPAGLIDRAIEAEQPFAAWQARAMLAVCYGEKAIYEIPDAQLTPERVLAELRAVEQRLLLLDGSPRPILAVPHLLSGDSSAYYHGYVLAEMAMHQARAFFVERDGHLVDNPRVGPTLADAWWKPGNSQPFDVLMTRVLGSGLSARAFAHQVNRDVDTATRDAHAAIDRLARVPPFDARVDLGAAIQVVHGRETIATLHAGDFEAFSLDFAQWIDRFARTSGAGA